MGLSLDELYKIERVCGGPNRVGLFGGTKPTIGKR